MIVFSVVNILRDKENLGSLGLQAKLRSLTVRTAAVEHLYNICNIASSV